MELSFEKYINSSYSFDDIRPKIKLSLVDPSYITTGSIIHTKVCERLYAIPVVDAGDNIINYTRHKDDNRPPDDIINDALAATFDEEIHYTGVGKKINEIGFEFYEVTGDSYFLTSLIINPLFLNEYAGKNGILFSLVSRNLYHIAVLDDINNIELSITLFGMVVFQSYLEATMKKLLPDLFYYKDDNYLNIVQYDETGDFDIKLPDNFK